MYKSLQEYIDDKNKIEQDKNRLLKKLLVCCRVDSNESIIGVISELISNHHYTFSFEDHDYLLCYLQNSNDINPGIVRLLLNMKNKKGHKTINSVYNAYLNGKISKEERDEIYYILTN
ncbi:hypothetical protein [Erwinia amylovora]|uniref:hypothetical protein n=1 Tax=Erwinia amylovora TaxID=552 RepID=UPI0014444A29|nr:hypothetical protein [Erwinia amylovora]